MIKKTIKLINNYIYKSIIAYVEYNHALTSIESLVKEENITFYTDIINNFPRKHRSHIAKLIYSMVQITDDKIEIYNALAKYKFDNNIILTKRRKLWLKLKSLFGY